MRVPHHRPDVSSADVLIGYLRERRVLLVLDNCEPVLDPVVDLVDRLICEAPGLQILATSRVYLGVFGEHLVRLDPLPVPPPAADRAEAVRCDAVRMLLDRAAAAGRPLTEADDWPVIVRLVRWSDGVPLILELVAAQLRDGRAPAEVLKRLGGGRSLIYPAGTHGVQKHHLTLDAAIAESWDRCTPAEQRVWARLTVFTGGFTVDAAEQVCASGRVDRAEVLETLDRLVRYSIIEGASERGRYRQHTYLREFGLRQLGRSGELEATRLRHLAWVAALAGDAARTWFGPGEVGRLKQVQAESGNIAAAVAWCADRGNVDAGLGIVVDVLRTRASFSDATEIPVCRLAESLLEKGKPEPSAVRVTALAMVGWVWIVLGARDRGKAHLDACLGLAGRAGLSGAPAVLMAEGTYEALALGQRSGFAKLAAAREGFRAVGEPGEAFMAGLFHAITAGLLGPAEEADRMSQWCVAQADTHGAEWAMTWAAWTQGLPESSARPGGTDEAFRRQVGFGDLWGPVWWVERKVWALAHDGEFATAARLAGGSDSLQARHGVRMDGIGPFLDRRERATTAIVNAMGQAAFDVARKDGAALADEQILALALGDLDVTPALSERQWTIVALVSEGRTTAEMAGRLKFSRRVVEKELTAIYGKLHLKGRDPLAKWYRSRGAAYRVH